MPLTNFPKPAIIISKCIGFDPCRYDGGIVHDKFVARLKPHIEVISVCPEVEIGMGIPRAPVRIICSGDELKLIQPSSGLDLSESMREFTSEFLGTLEKVDGFILKNRSPSCAFRDVKFYSGVERGPAIGRTAGLFGGAVLQKFGDLAVEDEGRLKNLSIREHFLTRIFALARLRKLQQSGSMHSLARFHSLNKLLLMAYSQTKLSELERIVANVDGERTAIVLNLFSEGAPQTGETRIANQCPLGHGLDRKFRRSLASFSLRAFCSDGRANTWQTHGPTPERQPNDRTTAKLHTQTGT
jgi:uncharacterized protein YbbK (DUF523 family)